MRRDEDNFAITVADDGIGFVHDVTTQVSGSFGLRTIRERLSFFGGTLEIKSQVGKGTQASISLPLAST